VQLQAGRDEDRLMSGAADLEEDLALVLELNLFVVELSREEHQAVGPQQLLARKACHDWARC
jgi:hypothetical protein